MNFESWHLRICFFFEFFSLVKFALKKKKNFFHNLQFPTKYMLHTHSILFSTSKKPILSTIFLRWRQSCLSYLSQFPPNQISQNLIPTICTFVCAFKQTTSSTISPLFVPIETKFQKLKQTIGFEKLSTEKQWENFNLLLRKLG